MLLRLSASFPTIAAVLMALVTSASATSYAAPERQDRPNRVGGYEQAYVSADVNVRSAPGTSSRVVNRLRRGDFVNVGECRAAWCYVDVHGGSGWMSGRFIGRGENSYHSRGPAGPGIPPQEPGTRY